MASMESPEAEESRLKLFRMINDAWIPQAVAAACALRLPEQLEHGPQRAETLAVEQHVDPTALKRLLRALVTLDLVAEHEDGGFSLAARGRWLLKDQPGSLRDWALMSASRVWRQWSDLRESIATGKSARRRKHGRDDFGELETDPEAAEIFNRAMISAAQPVAAAFAREAGLAFGGRIVDLGGGAGHFLAELLRVNPEASGIVLDLAHARAIAETTFLEAGIAGRARFMAGDFFESVPEADTYVMKSVLHNWDDARAARIVSTCAQAMRPESRLFIVERLMPVKLSASVAHRDIVRADLQMLVACDGRERTESEFSALIEQANLRIKAVTSIGYGFFAIEAGRW